MWRKCIWRRLQRASELIAARRARKKSGLRAAIGGAAAALARLARRNAVPARAVGRDCALQSKARRVEARGTETEEQKRKLHAGPRNDDRDCPRSRCWLRTVLYCRCTVYFGVGGEGCKRV